MKDVERMLREQIQLGQYMIALERRDPSRLTKQWWIMGIRDTILGTVEWSEPLREYCFFSMAGSGVVLDYERLDSLSTFLKERTEQRRKGASEAAAAQCTDGEKGA